MQVLDLSLAKELLEQLTDPEIPVITLSEMGILRAVEQDNDTVVVTITPTYSGCPAMQQIREDIISTLQQGGFAKVEVQSVLSPAWTTDWMTDNAKAKLRAYGIAPPVCTSQQAATTQPISFKVACPQCGSMNTAVVSEFGSTSCKALWRCKACREPFDYFKPF
jgi:ring-1,2-phenylacetyl-CoA epoxidase subunit PaaD